MQVFGFPNGQWALASDHSGDGATFVATITDAQASGGEFAAFAVAALEAEGWARAPTVEVDNGGIG